MMKILIVDDEKITREWIKKKIEEISADYKVEAVFSNGRQALEYCKNEKVDLIFTDIRMSVMDGIEFLRELSYLDIKPFKVIISAYDDFAYAREAIKLGVNEFLLKPEITQTELERILETAQKYVKSIDKENKQDSKRQQDILRDFVEKNTFTTKEEAEAILVAGNIFLEEANLVSVCIWTNSREHDEKLIDILGIFFEDKKIKWYFYQNLSNELIIVYNQVSEYSREVVITELFAVLKINMGVKLYMGVSSKKNGLLKLNTLKLQATTAKNNRYFYQLEGFLLYDDMHVNKKDEAGELYYSDIIKDISRLLDKDRYDLIMEKIEVLLSLIQKSYFLPPNYVEILCNELLYILINKIRKEDLQDYNHKELGNMQLIVGEKVNTFIELKERMYNTGIYLCTVLRKKSNEKRYSSHIKDAVEYIENNYKDKIMMEDVAKKIHLSRTYFSILFKKETGEKFSDYIQRIRLENAEKLLMETSLSISEIAENTGFFDVSHFSRIFKEKYRISPLEYRKRNDKDKIIQK